MFLNAAPKTIGALSIVGAGGRRLVTYSSSFASFALKTNAWRSVRPVETRQHRRVQFLVRLTPAPHEQVKAAAVSACAPSNLSSESSTDAFHSVLEAASEDLPKETADVLKQLTSAVRRQIIFSGKKITKLQAQLRNTSEADEWLEKGEALVRLPKRNWHRGMTQVEAPSLSRYDEDGKPLMIWVALKSDKDFQENAKLCFKQAGKIRRGRDLVLPLLEDTKASLEHWEARLTDLLAWEAQLREGLLDPAAVASISDLQEQLLEEGIIKRPKPPEPPPDPRLALKRKYGKDIDCFRSPGGYEVLAGRSSKMNDHISRTLAKGDLVWLHAGRGIQGSHVLIKARWHEVGDADIEFAAQIAAYHSKATDKPYVPVTYCKGQQVRKFKGASQGAVAIEGTALEIKVSPALPDM